MSTRRKSSVATTVRPAQTGIKPSVAVAAGVGVAAALPLRPPLEAALDAFTRELRAALDRAATDLATLRAELTQTRAELAQLRQRYDTHSHSYQKTSTGGGAQQWIEMRFLQGYIDGEHEGFNKYGVWARAKSAPDALPEQQTSAPSA